MLARLIGGTFARTPMVLKNAGLDQTTIDSNMQELKVLNANCAIPAMPIQDTIDLAEFAVSVTAS